MRLEALTLYDFRNYARLEASFVPGSKKPKLKRFALVAISLMHSMFSSTFSRSVNGEGNKKSARTL